MKTAEDYARQAGECAQLRSDLAAARAALGKLILGGGLETRHDAFGTHHYLSVQPRDFQAAHETLSRLGAGEVLAVVREVIAHLRESKRCQPADWDVHSEKLLARLEVMFVEEQP